MKDHKIEYLNLADLQPYDRNARLHSDRQVEQLAASIREFGFNNPILIDADMNIIAGHARHAAAQALEMEHVPCIRLGHLTPEQARLYVIADNRLAESGSSWDWGLLKLEFEELQLTAPELDLGLTGFEPDYVIGVDGGGEDWKPNLSPDTAGKTYSEDDVGGARDGLDNRYNDRKLSKVGLREVACPHCGESFEIEL